MTSIDEQIARFPYINGSLFEGDPQVADFNSAMREQVLLASGFGWSQISPAIFGSLFQTVMDSEKRRAMGAHYTSEKNILKTIEPLFLDELRAEFEAAKRHPEALRAFHDKIANLRFFDPACGCGNFLIVAYREMRLLEIDVLRALYPAQEKRDIPIERLCRIDVDHFYGIEVERFPARIATAAMWLTDHQMNRKASAEMGEYFARIPLAKSPHISEENALRRNWREILPPDDNVFVFGNPPFVGRQYRTADQRADMELVFGKKSPGTQNLDYVCAWHLKAAKFIRGTAARAAFVSTNSISQGEQVGALWPRLFAEGMKIRFAHRTFNWSNEARGKAHVHVVVIVGYGAEDAATKTIFEYGDINGESRAIKVAKHQSVFCRRGKHCHRKPNGIDLGIRAENRQRQHAQRRRSICFARRRRERRAFARRAGSGKVFAPLRRRERVHQQNRALVSVAGRREAGRNSPIAVGEKAHRSASAQIAPPAKKR